MHAILLTFDVEDWFQVENFKKYIPYSSWSSQELRVKKNTLELLDLLSNAPVPIQATFFVLGWVAERLPDLVREIDQRGHEVASHGYEHHLCYNQSLDELRRDLVKSKELLEDIIGKEVSGYRAPSFSISDEVLTLVQEAGYTYDSSYNSYEGHGRYGSLQLPKDKQLNSPIYPLSSTFHEIPVSNLSLSGKIIPWGGGGYFRLLPAFLHEIGVKYILKRHGCYTFYMHPWEIDPNQPKVREAKLFFRFRHYVNIKKTKKKLENFVTANGDCNFLACRELIKTKNQDYQIRRAR